MTDRSSRRTQLFISYSHADRGWLSRVQTHFSPLERLGRVHVWSDTRIGAGSSWRDDLEAALTDSRLAVLIVTPPYLASGFIWQEEMPRIMAHREDGMEVLPLIARPCAWRVMPELEPLQARPQDGVPLSSVSEAEADSRLAEFTYELATKLDRMAANVADEALRSIPEQTRSSGAAELETGESWPERASSAGALRVGQWLSNDRAVVQVMIDRVSSFSVDGALKIGAGEWSRFVGGRIDGALMLRRLRYWSNTGDEFVAAFAADIDEVSDLAPAQLSAGLLSDGRLCVTCRYSDGNEFNDVCDAVP